MSKFENAEIDIFSSIAKLRDSVTDFSKYSLLVSDIELPNENIFDFLIEIKSLEIRLPILIVSMHNKLSVIKKCKELRIEGYMLKDDQISIVSVIDTILNGEEFYSNKVKETLKILNKKEKILTPKEEQIVSLIAKGNSNKEIIEKIFVSTNTLKTHRKNIYRKLEVNTAGELVKYYYDNYL